MDRDLDGRDPRNDDSGSPDTPIRRLITNDIGPFIPKEALRRIAGYILFHREFDDLTEAIAYFREINSAFGPMTDDQWEHLAQHSTVPRPQGGLRLKYDPKIGEPFRDVANDDVDLWEVWDAIRCTTLVLRGESSDVLLADTAEEMTRRGPKAEIIEMAGAGHAPMLMDPGQVATLRNWLYRAAS